MSDIVAKCKNCGFEGLLSQFLATTTFNFVKHTNKKKVNPETELIKYIADIAHVHLLFRCPKCGKEVGVNVDGLSGT